MIIEGTVDSVLGENHGDLSSVQKEQGTDIFISVLSNRCCPYLHDAAHLAYPSLLTTMFNTWKS